MASIKDVAERAGVSISTVSRVLNGTKKVSPDLAEKVYTAVSELEYSANMAAKSLRSARSGLIAVIVTSFSRPYFTGILDGINSIASEHGYTVLLAETHDSLETEMRLVSEFVDRCVDGIILASSAYDTSERTKAYIHSLASLQKKETRIPLITLEYAFSDVPVSAIVIDNEKSAYEAVSYLVRDLGRRNIVHISLPKEHLLGKQRLSGYRKALRENGLTSSKKYVREGDYSTYSGYCITNDLLDSGQKIDAIFCANDQMAVGAVLSCNEHDIKIPQEIAIMGNDDIFAASLVRPSLSSIHVSQYDLGQRSMSMLLDEIEEGFPGGRIEHLDTQIVKRSSTEKDHVDDLKNLVW